MVQASAEPYVGGSGPVGVLFCHGFTGSPASMVPWARVVEAAGFRVSVPRLPGHGTTWQELNRTAWTDWYAAVDAAFATLSAECEQVFVFGLSMGGALALRLAEQHGSAVAGLVLVNPAIHVADPRMKVLPVLRVLPSLAGISNDIARPGVSEGAYDRTPLRALYSQTGLWADVRANLARVDQPLLVYRSAQDHVVDPSSLALLQAGVSSTDTTYVTLARSYHVATLDYEAADIFDGSIALLRRLAVTGTASGD
ncbi:MAG: putative esterase [Friedmanniella sp.]|nr:putative esterase [Friedmanniella sp.]